MSAFSFDAGRESFAKARDRFADCFIEQIVPDSLHCTTVFESATFCGFVFSSLNLTKIIHYYFVLHINKTLCHQSKQRR